MAETTLDPQKVSDLYSDILNSAMFDSPLEYDYLARPLKLKPNTLASMPEISADGLTYTLRVRPGIFFADDPVFGGKKRELVAEDYVYSMKRLMDPKLAAPLLSEIEGIIVGSDEALAKARQANRFDYDAPLEGLKALDRYTWQIKLTKPFYVFIYNLADCRVSCAVAREAVEHYGDDIGSHPVGTGPFRLAYWKRSSKLVFEANRSFREEYFDGKPRQDDAEGQAVLAMQKGKRLPMVGKVEIYIVEEAQPRWLAFLNEEHDLAFEVSSEFANVAMPNNRLAPNLRKRGIHMSQMPALDLTFAYFNMEDPVVGGYTPEKVALRRAISLAYNTRDEIAVIRKGQAILAHTPYSPGVAGYDPDFHTSANEYSVAKARALLDMFDYLDRDGDGYREMPDGTRARPAERLHAQRPRPADRRALEAQHGRRGAPDDLQEGQVAGPSQGIRCRQADDVAVGRNGGRARRRYVAHHPLRPECRVQGQPGAVQARRLRPALRARARDARQPGAHEALPGNDEAGRGLCPLEGQYAPHPHGHVVSVGARIPTSAGTEQFLLEVHRHRPFEASALFALTTGAPMDPIAHLALATLVFLATHFVTSTPLRGSIVEAIGERVYLGAYSLVSFLTIGWMVWAYLRAPFQPLWEIPGVKLWPLVVMPLALILVAAGVMTRNPTAVGQAAALKAGDPAQGILRITRHPLMWGIALWAAVHLLARGDVASLVFFGGFLVLALAGTALIDARKADTLGEEWARFAAVTSNVPFSAIVEGRNHFSAGEIGAKRVAVGLVLFAILLVAHPWLFGVRAY